MASAEGGSVPNGVGYGKGCLLFSRLRGLGERRELPQRGPGQSPGRKRILAYFEGHRTLLFGSIWQKSEGDNLHECPPTPNSGGEGLVPRVPPVIYAHAFECGKVMPNTASGFDITSCFVSNCFILKDMQSADLGHLIWCNSQYTNIVYRSGRYIAKGKSRWAVGYPRKIRKYPSLVLLL